MNQEDLQIRRYLLVGAAVAIAGFVGTVFLITVLIATNFNPLDWLE